jgi:hypothetical protein
MSYCHQRPTHVGVPRTVSRAIRIIIPASLLAVVAHAQGNTPASFEAGDKSLASLIEFPETRGDGIASVRCSAIVSSKGKLTKNGCYSDNTGTNALVAAINKAAKKARLAPAVIDGRERSVYLQYQVEFKTAGENKTVKVYGNPGVVENVEAYGIEHVAAQRSITAETWQKVCPQRLRFLVWAKAHVAASGEQSNVSIASNDGPPITEKCSQAIIDTMNASIFVPAMIDGEAVPSTYVEPFGS